MLDIKKLKEGTILRVTGEDSFPFMHQFVITKAPYKWRGETAVKLRCSGYTGKDRYTLRIPLDEATMCSLFSYFEDNFICCVYVTVLL